VSSSRWETITLPGGRRRLRVMICGEITGSVPVVTLHGMASRPELDEPLHRQVTAAAFPWIAPLLPNHGTSSNASTFADLVAMVADALASLNIEAPHFIGHSLGGVVAYGLSDYPQLLAPGRLLITANSPIGPKYNRVKVIEMGLRLGLVGSDLGWTIQLATLEALLGGRLLPFGLATARVVLPPPRLHHMIGVLLDASTRLEAAPARLDEAGLHLIRYWGGLDLGVTRSRGAILPGEDRTLILQPHCSNFFAPMAGAIGADLATVAAAA
jgi:pimeloyl-ACP methyl ester carboxylesterase